MVLLLFVCVLVVDFSTFALKYILWVNPAPYSLLPTPLHPAPYNPTPYTLHPTPYILQPYTLHPTPYTLHPTSYIFGRCLPLNPLTLYPNPQTQDSKPAQVHHLGAEAPPPETLDPKPWHGPIFSQSDPFNGAATQRVATQLITFALHRVERFFKRGSAVVRGWHLVCTGQAAVGFRMAQPRAIG